MMDKTELRDVMRAFRKNMTAEDKTKRCRKITKNFLTLDEYKNCRTLLCYASLANEISTSEIIKAALKNKKTVAVPKCGDGNTISFYQIKSLRELTPQSMGIPEPDTAKCRMITDFSESVCVVPGLCFDSLGYRIGYGGGYYDRFLSNYNGTSVGLAYAETVILSVPKDIYDCKVEYIITDK